MARGGRSAEPAWVERARRIGIVAWAAVGVAVLVVMGSWLLARIASVLVPFILAFILVYVLKPIVRWLTWRGLGRVWAVAVTYVGLAVVLGLALGLLIPPLAAQLRDLVDAFPQYWDAIVAWAGDVRGAVSGLPLGEGFARWLADVPARLEQLGVALAGSVSRQAVAVGGVALSLILAPVLSFYLLLDLPRIRRGVTGFLPKDHQPEFLEIVRKVDVVMSGYLRGQLLVSLCVGVLTLVLFMAANLFLEPDVPYILALGLMAGVTNVVPYFGPWTTAIVAGIIGVFISPLHALVGLGVVLAAQQIDATFISPNVMSSAVDLHPALIIFVLMVGASQFGIMGMLLAIPVAAAAKAVFVHFYEKYVPAEPPSEDGACAQEVCD